MGRNKPAESTIGIVLRPGGQLCMQIIERHTSYFDHLITLLPKDLIPLEEDSALGRRTTTVFQSYSESASGEFREIHIISDRGTSKQLEAILAPVMLRATPDCRILIGGFHVSGDQFHRLTQRFESLTLTGCRLGPNWWQPSESIRQCNWLVFDSCVGVVPKTLSQGKASWPNLQSLYFWGSRKPPCLRSVGWGLDLDIDPRAVQRFSEGVCKALWSEGLQYVDFDHLDSVEFLKHLSMLSSLRMLWLDVPVTLEVFEWILSNKNIRDLKLNWAKDVSLPWTRLKFLKRLSQLRLDSTFLKDIELREISTLRTLRLVDAYYTDLTSESWPVILTWPGLSSFWGSTELTQGPKPIGLPLHTELKKFVVFNARMEWFRELLGRYPNIDIIEM